MNQAAYDAVEQAWTLAVKARALCPYADESAVGTIGYHSPPWYVKHGAIYFVNLAQPLSNEDVRELNEIGAFVNRSFVVSLAAVLEEFDIVPYGQCPDRSKAGGDHAQLAKWMRHRFAHGDWVFDGSDADHRKTRALLENLFPEAAAEGPGFVTAIDKVLEPLKNGVLDYIRASG